MQAFVCESWSKICDFLSAPMYASLREEPRLDVVLWLVVLTNIAPEFDVMADIMEDGSMGAGRTWRGNEIQDLGV